MSLFFRCCSVVSYLPLITRKTKKDCPNVIFCCDTTASKIANLNDATTNVNQMQEISKTNWFATTFDCFFQSSSFSACLLQWKQIPTAAAKFMYDGWHTSLVSSHMYLDSEIYFSANLLELFTSAVRSSSIRYRRGEIGSNLRVSLAFDSAQKTNCDSFVHIYHIFHVPKSYTYLLAPFISHSMHINWTEWLN